MIFPHAFKMKGSLMVDCATISDVTFRDEVIVECLQDTGLKKKKKNSFIV